MNLKPLWDKVKELYQGEHDHPKPCLCWQCNTRFRIGAELESLLRSLEAQPTPSGAPVTMEDVILEENLAEAMKQPAPPPDGINAAVRAPVHADTLLGAYTGGNALKAPQPIDWQAWQRVADYVNTVRAERGHR